MAEMRTVVDKRTTLWDTTLLVGTALLVVATAVASFVLGELYHLNVAWLFFAWNSILMIPLFIRNFRGHLRRLPSVLFLTVWGLIHGMIVVCLMRWVPVPYWIPVLGVELFLGYAVAHWGFELEPIVRN